MPPQPFTTLKQGKEGEAVFWLQMKLKELGYYAGAVTGQYLTGTKKAVKAFQKASGIYPTGDADEKTLRSIYADVLITATPAPTSTPAPTPAPTTAPATVPKATPTATVKASPASLSTATAVLKPTATKVPAITTTPIATHAPSASPTVTQAVSTPAPRRHISPPYEPRLIPR